VRLRKVKKYPSQSRKRKGTNPEKGTTRRAAVKQKVTRGENYWEKGRTQFGFRRGKRETYGTEGFENHKPQQVLNG